MQKSTSFKKAFHVSLGIILLCLGLLGLVLPIINGIIPILLGLILISFTNPSFEKKLTLLSKKNKHLEHWHDKLSKHMRHFFGINKEE